MKLLPHTLFGRVLATLFVGLLVTQVVGLWLMIDDRSRFGGRLRGALAAQRLAGIISVIDAAAPGDRERVVRALNVLPTRLQLDEPWQDQPGRPAEDDTLMHTAMRFLWPPPPPDAENEDAEDFLHRVAHELDRPLQMQVLAITRIAAPQDEVSERLQALLRERGLRPILSVIGQVRLHDGAVLTFRYNPPAQNNDWPLRLLGSLTVLALSVALLAAWTVRRITRPLDALSRAASGLARNLDQPPLAEHGPQEVASAAQAFNTMQREIKNYLATRAAALAAVSHDLRLPITRMRLRIDQLADEHLKDGMESDLAEMDEMIAHTLEFLRAGSPAEAAVPLDFNALVDSACEDMAALGLQVDVRGAAASPLVGRPLALRRCLSNLLDNAHRYAGGAVEVSISDDNDWVSLLVKDRGPGIPASELERVFEPYVRMESSRAKQTGGTGLGLAIARAIAKAHGGNVGLRLREGGGLIAELRLPRHVRPN